MIVAMMMAVMTPQDAESTGKPLDNLIACKSVSDAAARLSCYDNATKLLIDAERQRDVVVLNRAQVQKTKRSLFGFSLPSIKLFGDGDADAQLKRVSGTLRASQPLPGGLRRFVMDDGGVWEATEESVAAPRVGDTMTISAGALGSYVATAPGRRSVRVRRIR